MHGQVSCGGSCTNALAPEVEAGYPSLSFATPWHVKGSQRTPPVILPCSRETYNALTNWLTDARTLASPNIVIILCGNKKDLDADREVTFLEASRFAQENGKAWKWKKQGA